MIAAVAPPHVTPHPWPRTLDCYGDEATYRHAAEWLQDCPTVADWGGARGYFRRFLPESVEYTVVDGTQQVEGQVLADLVDYHAPSDGILLRHVLDNTTLWKPVLRNALKAFRQRLVVITFTPRASYTHRIAHKNGYPFWYFDPHDLRREMGHHLVCEVGLPATHPHPEHVYLLERRAA